MTHKAPRLPDRLWPRRVRGAIIVLSIWLGTLNPAMAADTIVAARYIEPTTRYAHGVLGDAIEFGALEITVQNTAPPELTTTEPLVYRRSVVTIRLPLDRVFEDLEPRLADVDQNGTFEVLAIESQQDTGAQLAIYNAKGKKIAATPHIGTRNRWLATIGAADLDGDGYIEIAYIDRPHLAKTLRIWRFREGQFTEIANLPGLTNHKIGEDFISGGVRDCENHPELILASADWSRIISVSFNDGWKRKDLGPLRNRKDLSSALTC